MTFVICRDGCGTNDVSDCLGRGAASAQAGTPAGPGPCRADYRGVEQPTPLAPGARGYALAVTAAGLLVLGLSVGRLLRPSPAPEWLLLTALAAVSSSAPLRLRAAGVRFSFGDTFSFAAMFLYGPAAGAVTSAVDSLACGVRLRDLPLLQTAFNVAAPSLSMWLAGTVAFRLAGLPLPGSVPPLPVALVSVAATTALFFALETGLIATAVALERGLPYRRVWRRLAGLWLNPAVGAYGGFLVALFNRALGLTFLLLILPIPVLLYYTFRTWLGRVEDRVHHLEELGRSQDAVRQRDEQLRQAQKMEAIGRLAGGVAHDFNNLLTLMHGFAELVLKTLDRDDRRRADMQEILAAAERGAGLTRQLLAFSRRQVLEPKVLSLDEVVQRTGTMLRRLIGDQVRLATTAEANLGRVRADVGQIEQVLLNLAVNARDAMPGGGDIAIDLANVDLADAEAAALGLAAGPYVRLAVGDTGSGMDADTCAHIFEPFFTTKEEGKGTGLGLATVYGIVQQSGGAITVESQLGVGTTFRIHLPRVADDIETEEAASRSAGLPPGSETVLLVEDEERLRTMVAETLRTLGYTVMDAPSATGALEAAGRHDGPIHLLLTDVVMPGGSGPALADDLSAVYPRMRVLFMSGYPDEEILGPRARQDERAFMQKPFAIDDLAVRIRELLDCVETGAEPG